MNRDEMHQLAVRLEHDGVTGAERELAKLVAAARRAGVRPVAASVLADRHAPEVARVRAFAIVSVALATAPPARLVAA